MATVIEAPPVTEPPEGCELIDGIAVEPEPMSAYAAAVANRLHTWLAIHAEQTGRGQAFMDMFFRVPLREDRYRVRKPDTAFVSFDRWPADRPISYRGNPLPVVPDLMVEVASPTDEAEELLGKAYQYLRAGARLVWIVFPANRSLFAYTAPTAVRAFSDGDALDGGDVLPDFRLPMTTLFPPVVDLPEPKDDE